MKATYMKRLLLFGLAILSTVVGIVQYNKGKTEKMPEKVTFLPIPAENANDVTKIVTEESTPVKAEKSAEMPKKAKQKAQRPNREGEELETKERDNEEAREEEKEEAKIALLAKQLRSRRPNWDYNFTPEFAARQMIEKEERKEELEGGGDEGIREYMMSLELGEQERAKTISPNGDIPRQNIVSELKKVELLSKKDALLRRTKTMLDANTDVTLTWNERGPNNVGGRTRAIVVDPNDATGRTIWVGTAGGGLWKGVFPATGTAGPTWSNVGDAAFSVMAVCAIAIDPTDTQHFYVGTGEGWNNADSQRGVGIFESTNGGATWSPITSTMGDTAFFFTNKLACLPNGDLLAGTARGLYKKAKLGTTFAKIIPAAPTSYAFCTDIELAVTGSTLNRAYATLTTNYFTATSNAQFYSSVDGNAFIPSAGLVAGAGSFQQVLDPSNPGDGNRVEIANNGLTVYAIVQQTFGGTQGAQSPSNVGDVGNGLGVKAFMKSTDGGVSWVQTPIPGNTEVSTAPAVTDFSRSQAWYDLALAVDPTNANNAVCGAIDIWKTVNGGNGWSQISDWQGLKPGLSSVHSDHHVLLYGPNNTLYLGCDGGIYRATNASATIPTLVPQNTGFNITQYYAADGVNIAGSNGFLAGAQDNGTQLYDSPGIDSTEEVSGGDGMVCHVNQLNPLHQISSYVYNNYYRSLDGASFSSATGGSNDGQFVNPCDLDDVNETLYSAGNSDTLYRWKNFFGATAKDFIKLDAGAATINADRKPTAVTVSPNNPQTVYVGNDVGRIYRVTNANGTAVVTDISGKGMGGANPDTIPGFPYTLVGTRPAVRYTVASIDVWKNTTAGTQDDTLLVCLSNFGIGSNVYLCTNANSASPTWKKLDNNSSLPDVPVRWGVFHPLSSKKIILGTEVGAFTCDSLNLGAATIWRANKGGMGNIRIDMLQLRRADNVLIAATHGRGLYVSDPITPLVPAVAFKTATTDSSETVSGTVACGAKKSVTIEVLNPFGLAAVADVVVDETVANSATSPYDYSNATSAFRTGATTWSIPFAAGEKTKSFTLDILDDAVPENKEVITLRLTTPTAGYTVGLATHTVSIGDDDVDVTNLGSGIKTLFTENFEGATIAATQMPAGWLRTDTAGFTTYWKQSSVAPIGGTGKSANIAAKINGVETDNTYDTNLSASVIAFSPVIDARGYKNITSTYTYTVGGESDVDLATFLDFGQVGYSLDGQTFVPVSPRYALQANETTVTLNMPAAVANQQFRMAFKWNNDPLASLTPQGLKFDNVTVRGLPRPVDTIVDAVNSVITEYVGPNQTVVFQGASGAVMARIKNLSTFDYGCTTVSIDRQGKSATVFSSNTNGEKLTDKTFRVQPTNSNPSGAYQISLYYATTEVNGWQTATSKVWGTDAKVHKVATQIKDVTPANPNGGGAYYVGQATSAGNAGDEKFITASFNSSFSGFAAGAIQTVLPIELVSFTAMSKDANVYLTWITATEINTDRFVLEHSADGSNFQRFAEQKAAGNSNQKLTYNAIHSNPVVGTNYYRLRTIDLDGTENISAIQEVLFQAGKFITAITPTLANDRVTVQYGNLGTKKMTLRIFNEQGQLMNVSVNNTNNTSILDVSTLSQGAYLLEVSNGVEKEVRRFVIQR